jgi:nucleoside-diphosphate-sugar epimerase
MKILVVGCGYIGWPLAVNLARAGHEVHGMRRSFPPAIEADPPGLVRLQADITRPATLEHLPAGYDWVVLCAASGGGGPEAYRSLYVEGTRNVMDWLAGGPPRKLVYTSSTSVYGQDDGSVVDEASPTHPPTETGQLLVQAERQLLAAARAGEVPAVVLRLAGIYGPGRGYWFRRFLAGEALIEGRGQRYLNMIHRDDVIGAVIAALERAGAGEIFNVVDNEPVSQVELFKWLARRLDRPMPPSIEEDAAVVRKRGSSNKRVSNRKLATQLGYQLKYPTFREGYEAETPTDFTDSTDGKKSPPGIC